MKRLAAFVIAMLVAGAGAAYVLLQPARPVPAATDGVRIEVPSGQEVVFVDIIQGEPGPGGLTYRFRFIAPAIARDGGTVSMEEAHDDMQALCDLFALPRIAATGPQPAQVVISLSDRPVAFGQQAPEATQFFEAYRIDAGKCVWEIF